MTKPFTNHFVRALLLYLFFLANVFVFWAAESFGGESPLLFYYYWAIMAILFTAIQYIFLFLKRKYRVIVWIINILGIVFALFGWASVVLTEYNGYYMFGETESLLITYLFFFMLLFSSCIVGWAIAPSRNGRTIFIVVDVLFAVMSVHTAIVTKNWLHLLNTALMLGILPVLCFWHIPAETIPKDKIPKDNATVEITHQTGKIRGSVVYDVRFSKTTKAIRFQEAFADQLVPIVFHKKDKHTISPINVTFIKAEFIPADLFYEGSEFIVIDDGNPIASGVIVKIFEDAKPRE